MSRVSRRGILGGAVALVPAAAVGVGALPSPANPDAGIIAVCADYIRNVGLVNADDSLAALDDNHPFWQAYQA